MARRADALKALVDEIHREGGEALMLAGDATDQAAVSQAAVTVAEVYGGADLLFNNAGLMLPGPIDATPFAQWQQQIDVNITAAMGLIHAFIPQLTRAAEQGRQVDLVNTSSIAGQYIYPYFAVYSATKAYTSHLTRHLRVELGPKNIRVSMIEPGIVATELQGHWTFQGAKDWLAHAEKDIEFLQPQDVAEVLGFLVSLPRHVNLQQVVVMPTRQAT